MKWHYQFITGIADLARQPKPGCGHGCGFMIILTFPSMQFLCPICDSLTNLPWKQKGYSIFGWSLPGKPNSSASGIAHPTLEVYSSSLSCANCSTEFLFSNDQVTKK